MDEDWIRQSLRAQGERIGKLERAVLVMQMVLIMSLATRSPWAKIPILLP